MAPIRYDGDMDAQSLQIEALPLHRRRPVGTTQTDYVLIKISAPKQVSGPLPRLTTMLLLDVSGSMKGNPLSQVKESVARLSSILSDEDALGVVTFSTSAQTVVPIQTLSSVGVRRGVERAGESLLADGYTNMSAGLSHAALQFPPRAPDERQLVLLLSDGQPNVGTQSIEGLSGEAALIKSRGVAVSTLGYGAQHNEDLLLALADAAGGRYAYVKDTTMAASSFARALGAQRDVVAEDVALTLAPAPGVEILRVLGEARTSFGEGGLRIALSDMLLGEEIHVVVEIKLTTRREVGRFRLLKLTLHSRPTQALAASRSAVREPEVRREEVHIDLYTPTGLVEDDVDPRAKELVTLALVVELRQKARALFDQRNFAAAIPVLHKAKDLVEAAHGGVTPEDGPLHDLHEALLDDLQLAAKAPKPDEYSVLRKTNMDQQMLKTGLNRGVTQNSTPSAQHMVLKLQGNVGPPPRARLVFVEGNQIGKVVPVGPECRIGRGRDNDLVLDDVLATRRHALIQWVGRGFIAHDLGSSSGTYVNGRHIVDDYVLQDGDLVQIGAHKLRFERLDRQPDPQPPAGPAKRP